MAEMEAAWEDFDYVQDDAEELIKHIVSRVLTERKSELEIIGRDWKKLEAKQDEAMSDLNEKRGDLVKENISDIKSMEEGVRAHIEEDKKFNEAFVERQNEVFDKIERFNSKP